MSSKFLLFFDWLNLISLTLEKTDKVVKKYKLISIKVVKIIEYDKKNNKY